MQAIDMKKIYSNKSYKGNWVALKSFTSNPEVIAYAKTLHEVLKKAKQKGYDMPLVTQIPKKVLPIVGFFDHFDVNLSYQKQTIEIAPTRVSNLEYNN